MAQSATNSGASTNPVFSEAVANCQLVNVRASKISSELCTSGSEDVDGIQFLPEVEYLVDANVFLNRFTYKFDLQNAAAERLAVIEFSLLAEWAVHPDYVLEDEAANYLATTVGYLAAYPYARELLHSLTMKLGLDSVVLGTVIREQFLPGGVTIASRFRQLEISSPGETELWNEPSSNESDIATKTN